MSGFSTNCGSLQPTFHQARGCSTGPRSNHSWRSTVPSVARATRRRRAVLIAVPVLAASTVVAIVGAVARPAAASAAASPCLPYQLPGMSANGAGEVITTNDSGTYVGAVFEADFVAHAAWWTHTGSDMSTGWTVHVPDIPEANTEFLDVNPAGIMVGFSLDAGGFVYDSNTGAITSLPDFASGHAARGRRINASGVVAGAALDDSGTSYAAIWRPPYTSAERVHAPGESQNFTFPDGTHVKVGSETDGINDQGAVAGYTF